LEGKFFINPGSATGAMSSGWWGNDEKVVPSFVLMDVRNPHWEFSSGIYKTIVLMSFFSSIQVQGNVLVLYVYQLRTDEEGNESVADEKVTFIKNGGGEQKSS